MTIVLFSNYLNHHQLPIMEAFNAIEGVEYFFVATESIPDFRVKLGYKKINSNYLIDTTLSIENKIKAQQLSVSADVAIYLSSGVEGYEKLRLKTGKLTFDMSERWLKKGWLNLLSPRLWKRQLVYYINGRNKPLYMLCNSAYAPNDYYLLQSYKDRCYKWGYYPAIHEFNIKENLASKRNSKISIMWCARFIKWKHPEHVLSLAKKLKLNKFDFRIDMYGNGPLLQSIGDQISELGLSEYVHLKGNACNEEIINAMQLHNVFLFTSDRNEGWGVVANEAMNNGCTLVAAKDIGAVPYLVKNRVNGLIYNNQNQLYDCVTSLIKDRAMCEQLAKNAYNDIICTWNPTIAARRFLGLIEALSNKKECPYLEGPCSKAYPIDRKLV